MKNFINKDYQLLYSDDYISYIKKDDFTIVIPVLNEEKAIGKVLYNVKKEGYKNILVVDGYSNDNTVKIASNNGGRVIYQKGIGKTGAIKTAIKLVKTKYMLIMDGDCTYDPKEIYKFYKYILNFDEVIGSRTYGKTNIPILNRLGNFIINTLFNLFFGTNLVDVCSGMYAIRTDFAKKLILKTKSFDVEVEIAAQAALNGRIISVPINYYKRVGKQKLRPFKHGFQILNTIIKMGLFTRTYFRKI